MKNPWKTMSCQWEVILILKSPFLALFKGRIASSPFHCDSCFAVILTQCFPRFRGLSKNELLNDIRTRSEASFEGSRADVLTFRVGENVEFGLVTLKVKVSAVLTREEL